MDTATITYRGGFLWWYRWLYRPAIIILLWMLYPFVSETRMDAMIESAMRVTERAAFITPVRT